MKSRHVVKKTHLVRLGSVSRLTKGGRTAPEEFLGEPRQP